MEISITQKKHLGQSENNITKQAPIDRGIKESFYSWKVQLGNICECFLSRRYVEYFGWVQECFPVVLLPAVFWRSKQLTESAVCDAVLHYSKCDWWWTAVRCRELPRATRRRRRRKIVVRAKRHLRLRVQAATSASARRSSSEADRTPASRIRRMSPPKASAAASKTSFTTDRYDADLSLIPNRTSKVFIIDVVHVVHTV